MNMRKIALACLFPGILLAAKADHLPENFFFKKLPNGLEILVIEDANVPLATIELCVKNGSYTESPEFNGLSHLYEHMFFKANKKYPSQKAYLDRVNELGISFNGTTSNERVNYYITLSKDKLGEGMDFMNTAIRYPLFLEEEMKNENPVVAGEFQRNESNPFFGLFDRTNHELWGDLYSRKNVIGDYQMIYTATPEKMRIIKDKYYYPNNTLLAVAGDVNHEEVFREAEKYFGDWQPSSFDPFEKYPIPEFKPLEYASQFVVESPNAQVPAFMISFHGPDTRNDLKATYAADVFSFILGQQSARLQQELVETGLAFQVNVSYQTNKYVGPIQIVMIPHPMKVKEAYDVLWKNIRDFDTDTYFTDEQLQTAKDLLAVGEAYGSEAASQFIHTVTYWWASATIDYYTGYVDNLQKVTRDDIKEYVRKYIKERPYVAGVLVPEGMGEGLRDYFADTYKMEDYTLWFGQDDHSLADSANKAKLNSLSQWLRINPSVNIRIEAYEDDSEKKNTGKMRYESVLKTLTEAGMDFTRVTGTSNKSFQVIEKEGDTPDEIKSNRKVTFTIVKK